MNTHIVLLFVFLSLPRQWLHRVRPPMRLLQRPQMRLLCRHSSINYYPYNPTKHHPKQHPKTTPKNNTQNNSQNNTQEQHPTKTTPTKNNTQQNNTQQTTPTPPLPLQHHHFCIIR
jgi:hypothetical protein